MGNVVKSNWHTTVTKSHLFRSTGEQQQSLPVKAWHEYIAILTVIHMAMEQDSKDIFPLVLQIDSISLDAVDRLSPPNTFLATRPSNILRWTQYRRSAIASMIMATDRTDPRWARGLVHLQTMTNTLPTSPTMIMTHKPTWKESESRTVVLEIIQNLCMTRCRNYAMQLINVLASDRCQPVCLPTCMHAHSQ